MSQAAQVQEGLTRWHMPCLQVIIFFNGKKMDTIIGAVPKATLVQAVQKVRGPHPAHQPASQMPCAETHARL